MCRSPSNGVNVGVAQATGAVIVVANLDLMFDRDFLTVLLTNMEARWDFLAPAVWPLRNSIIKNGGGDGSTGVSRRRYHHRPAWVTPPPRPVDGLAAGVAVLHLGPVGEAGSHQVAEVVEGEILSEVGDVAGLFGPGAHDGKVTSQDVPHLGKLVEAAWRCT